MTNPDTFYGGNSPSKAGKPQFGDTIPKNKQLQPLYDEMTASEEEFWVKLNKKKKTIEFGKVPKSNNALTMTNDKYKGA